jgi:isorenieratene synthase
MARGGGSVLELHAYQVPPDIQGPEAIREALLADLEHYFPELEGYQILHEDLQVRDDFSSFFVGMHKRRPGIDTGIPGVLFAGDWVRIPCPAMLMEAAVTSSMMAANKILAEHGLREEPVYSVPLRSMMAFSR